MDLSMDKVKKAKAVLEKIADGVDPVSGAKIVSADFLHDPRIIRCFFYIADILDLVVEGNLTLKAGNQPFTISAEEKAHVRFPEGTIGVTQFVSAINEAIDPLRKPLAVAELNKQLRGLGILGEETGPTGKVRTTVSPLSAKYGFHLEKREFSGNEYEKVVYDDHGKQFLLENLERVLTGDRTLLTDE